MTPEELHERVRAEGLLGTEGQVVAMVSGGRDSVCLLDSAVAVRGAQNVRALHVNYGLRGRASYEDERYCAELCSELGVWLELVRVGEDERGAGNLQAWARERRYEVAQPAGGRTRRAGGGRATRPAIRSRRSSTGSRPRRAGARCWGCPRARGGSCARCWA